jgi:hypothetical protein
MDLPLEAVSGMVGRDLWKEYAIFKKLCETQAQSHDA